MSMKTSIVALFALSGVSVYTTPCLSAAENPVAPLAIYYSFDKTPSPALFIAMQSELDRILAPSQLRVTWRAIDDRPGTEAFEEIVILRFRGSCLFDADASGPSYNGATLADTELVDGRVLPFGEVQCDSLRHFLAPVTFALNPARGNKALGRAMARVSAHEIYHMLTRSSQHAREGIARAEHSRRDLLAATFRFARPEQDWLRLWAKRLASHELVARASPAPVVREETAPEPVVASSSFVSEASVAGAAH